MLLVAVASEIVLLVVVVLELAETQTVVQPVVETVVQPEVETLVAVQTVALAVWVVSSAALDAVVQGNRKTLLAVVVLVHCYRPWLMANPDGSFADRACSTDTAYTALHSA